MIYNNILQDIGNTPLIRLNTIVPDQCAHILVKYEGVNIGGSIKTRTAYQMIKDAEKAGKLTPNSIIVEPTSGNQGIGLALVAAVLGYKAKIIMPDSVSKERRALVKHYGAEVILIHDDGNIGECIDKCIYEAKSMQMYDSNVYVPQQFENTSNIKANNITAKEIINDVRESNVQIDGFCSGIGTGGTITGVGQVLKKQFPNIKIWAVEPQNAAILSGGQIKSHVQMGIGDGLIPDILDKSIYEQICIVTDTQAITTSKNLAAKEGLMCGITSGSNVFAAIKMGLELGPNKTVVTVLPDTGERYISTLLFQ